MVDAIWDLDLEQLQRRGVRGLILDLDNTLVNWNGSELRPGVAAWLAEAGRRRLRCCIVTNAGETERLRSIAGAAGASHLAKAGKPFPRAYRRAMRKLGTGPDSTAAIGDQVFTDILGANLLGLDTILVEPFSPREFIGTRFVRLVERPLRKGWRREERGARR
jgi:hypothetical protein